MVNNLPQKSDQKSTQQTVLERKSRKKEWFFILPVLFLIAVSVFMLTRGSSQLVKSSDEPDRNDLLSVSPTPFPFQDMTIPYLQKKKYKSSLGKMESYGNNDSYSSYLTSYTSDGFRVNGMLTIPKGSLEDYGWPASNASRSDAGWPAIVFIHGYIPPTQYRTGERYLDYVDYLARNGFVVFAIDLRGHGESGGEPGGGYYGSDYVIDALNARAALQEADFVNPDGVGMWGHSMAGNILMRSLAAVPEIPGIVIWAGAVYSYTDWQKYGIDDNSYSPPQLSLQRQNRRRELFEKHGSPSAQSAFWQQVAPTNYLSDIKGAIQIHHALDDNVVNIGYSRDLMKLLDETSVPHQLFEYESGGHNLTGGAFTTAMQRSVEFFKERL